MNNSPFGKSSEAIIYAALLLIVLWLVYWGDHLFPTIHFYRMGVRPKTLEGLKGVFLMPFIHSERGFEHIVNNSIPIFILTATLVYYYRSVALRVFILSWLLTGLGLWMFATKTTSYHIGISGVIYALAAFLFTSGVLRKYRPLQAISLFVAFVYGSMIWGIFPTKPQVSWEGHLSGLVVGVVLAFIYRRLGPQAPKYQYEIEKELGIEPPDLEGEWLARLKAREEQLERERLNREQQQINIIYHYKSKEQEPDDNDQQ